MDETLSEPEDVDVEYPELETDEISIGFIV
jgi:hypothetical protein